MGINFLSVTDKHPDPFFAQTVDRFDHTGEIDIERSYNPDPDDGALNLGMYAQGTEEALDMKLVAQCGVGLGVEKNVGRRNSERFKGLDERWKDPSEAERWVRGQQPGEGRGRGGTGQGQHRGRGGRGRGAGGGRGRGRGQ